MCIFHNTMIRFRILLIMFLTCGIKSTNINLKQWEHVLDDRHIHLTKTLENNEAVSNSTSTTRVLSSTALVPYSTALIPDSTTLLVPNSTTLGPPSTSLATISTTPDTNSTTLGTTSTTLSTNSTTLITNSTTLAPPSTSLATYSTTSATNSTTLGTTSTTLSNTSTTLVTISTTLGPTSTTLAPISSMHLNDTNLEVSWTPKYSPSVIIETDPGYIISVTIEYCDLNIEEGEHVTISTGKANETLLLTYKVAGKPKYLFKTNRLYVDFVGTNLTSFIATFTRIGEVIISTSTTEVPTTQNYPTAPSNISKYLTVFVSGKRAEEYKNDDIKNVFRSKVSQMAVEYCETENFDLIHEITINNVYYSAIVPCPSKWLGHETCAQITFAVPVFLNESTNSRWTGYQLSSSHLKIMWDRYSEKYFNEKLTVYVEPQLERMLVSRIIGISVVTIGFALGLLVVRCVALKIAKKGRKDHGDNIPIISNDSQEDHYDLYPYILQQTPPLFESIYSNYEPEQRFEKVPTTTTEIRRETEQSIGSGDPEVSVA